VQREVTARIPVSEMPSAGAGGDDVSMGGTATRRSRSPYAGPAGLIWAGRRLVAATCRSTRLRPRWFCRRRTMPPFRYQTIARLHRSGQRDGWPPAAGGRMHVIRGDQANAELRGTSNLWSSCRRPVCSVRDWALRQSLPQPTGAATLVAQRNGRIRVRRRTNIARNPSLQVMPFPSS
jgi:hypothetical protein